MGTYEDAAIEAVRDFLVDLLSRSEWCRAESVGRALKMLIGSQSITRGIPGGRRDGQENCDTACER